MVRMVAGEMSSPIFLSRQ
uniref:Uncharacterized protein n=1 Tax=Arundo donax TaxID=35708 RepID=A0A0A9BAV0_ARUDO